MSPEDLGALVLVLATAATIAAGAAWTRAGAAVWTPAAACLLGAAALVAAAPEDVVLSGSTARTALVTAAALLAVLGGGPVTTTVFGLVDRQDRGAPDLRRSETVLRGGAWIGALERAGVFVTLVAGWPEGVAVVLGLKGLGRYPELRSGENTGAAERFIIGTFTSVLWAAACAGLVRLLL
ncbi:hypothetical protein [Nocardioides ferulae]|uniref:hypothetical protein n=1 Tax=Nocardioides ferulae TaxID=2340821 RepID=UPI000EB4C476|nr:hypothetical protein [Nocardioides ferulae]